MDNKTHDKLDNSKVLTNNSEQFLRFAKHNLRNAKQNTSFTSDVSDVSSLDQRQTSLRCLVLEKRHK